MLAGTGGTARLTRLIGKAKALEMMVTGELMSFEDAHACNLINHIWEGDPDDFRRDILDWCSQFTLPNKAVKAVGNIKLLPNRPEIPSSTTWHLSVNSKQHSSTAVTPRKASPLTLRSVWPTSPRVIDDVISMSDINVPADVPDELIETYLDNMRAATAALDR